MFEDVNFERFTDLFCPAGFERSFELINRSAEGIVFAATNADCAKMDCRKIDLLLLKRFIERQKIIGNVPGAMRRRDNQPDPLRLQIFDQRSVQDSRAVTSLFQLFRQML